MEAVCHGLDPFCLVQGSQDRALSQTSSRQAECFGGCSFSVSFDLTRGMVPSNISLSEIGLSMVSTWSGPVCHQMESQTAQVCVFSAWSIGMGQGRSVYFLGRGSMVCLPSLWTYVYRRSRNSPLGCCWSPLGGLGQCGSPWLWNSPRTFLGYFPSQGSCYSNRIMVPFIIVPIYG